MKIRTAVAGGVFVSSVMAQSINGIWDATVKVDTLEVPFRMEFSGSGDSVRGAFFNGDERITSTGGRFTGNSLLLNFDHYASRLEATLEDGVLKGKYGNPARTLYVFRATPHRSDPPAAANAPSIGGVWVIGVDSPKGEHAWRFIVRQSGAEVAAAILRVDGDTGTLTGGYRDGRFLLSHFSGARPSVLEIEPKENGTLALTLKGGRGSVRQFTAVRESQAREQHLPEPTDPALHTRMKNPGEAFRFSFPDLAGRIISNNDAKFKDKVVIVNITGSWCPNCHDEAPFLAEMYRRYRSLGVEIVGLDFEEPEQLKDPTRLQAFLKKYGIEYTYLIAGEPAELAEKVPQAENLNAWPTTFFVGRDGRVRAIHAGFAAAASGEFHAELRREFTNLVERLAAESARASR